MSEWLLEHGSYFSITLLITLTGCGLPVPEEAIVVVAGVLSSHGALDPWLALPSCLLGSLLGDSLLYFFGYHFGHNLINRHPFLSRLMGAQREEHFEKVIARHGFTMLFFSRFMVGVRGPIYLAAGVMRMPYRNFFLYDVISATIVVGTFFGLSHAYGQRVIRYIQEAEMTFTLTAALIGLSVLLFFLRRRRLKRLDADVRREALAEAVHGEGEEKCVAKSE